MSKEGYLLYHEGEGRRGSHIYYCVLGEGYLQFYSRRDNGVLIKNVALTKSKLKIRGVPDHEAHNCPYSFSVVVHHAKIVEGRQIVYGKPTSLVLSAPSYSERKSWGNIIHSWQRNYWGEPVHRLSLRDGGEVDEFFDEQRRALEIAMNRPASAPAQGNITPTASSVTASSSSNSGTGGNGNGNGRRKTFFGRAPSIKNMGSTMRKKIRSASVTISLPPMTLNITSSLQQLRPQQQQQPQHHSHHQTQAPPATAAH